MRYWYPFTSDALEAVKRDGIERLVVLPLYPQFSISTSGSSLRVLEQEFYADQELRQVSNRGVRVKVRVRVRVWVRVRVRVRVRMRV
jgi:protoheme ferro-lyase